MGLIQSNGFLLACCFYPCCWDWGPWPHWTPVGPNTLETGAGVKPVVGTVGNIDDWAPLLNPDINIGAIDAAGLFSEDELPEGLLSSFLNIYQFIYPDDDSAADLLLSNMLGFICNFNWYYKL